MIYLEYRQWRKDNLSDEDGIIIASDQTQEWLLPWWWENYRKHNDHPVGFVDFGMTPKKKNWCKERGEFISLPVADIFVAEKEEIDPTVLAEWEMKFGNKFWLCRNAWFKKPLACLQSPFKRSIWIDLDCEIRGSLQLLFDWSEPNGIALVKEWINSPYTIYNSGVIVFRRGLSLIEDWAHLSFEKNHVFYGDQDILSYLIEKKKHPLTEMPTRCNWSRYYEENSDVLILHFHGEYGRSFIRHQMTFRE
jgi:hypothetical protein